MALDVQAARRALAQHIAEPLDSTVEEAAWAIHRQVNDDMASAARVHASERGHDPADLPIFAFGGAGPVHAAGVGFAMGTTEIVAAPSAGVMSAVGMLTAPMAFEFVRSSPDIVDDGVLKRASRVRAEMRDEGAMLLRASGVPTHAITFEESADMRYVGQGFELRVPIGNDGSSVDDAFRHAYRRKYGRTGPDVALEVLSWRVVARGLRPHLPLSSPRQPERTAEVVKGHREVWVAGRGFETVPVIDRYALRPGLELTGPVIVEERESTLVVPEDSTCAVGDDLSLTIAIEVQ